MPDEPELEPAYYGLEGLGHIADLEARGPDAAELDLERAIAAARRAGGVDVDPIVGFGRPSVRGGG